MLAVIETGGKQYIVETGEALKIEKLPIDEGGKVIFDKVLLLIKDKEVQVGKPYLEGVTVEATVTTNGRDRKIKIMRYKSKTRQRRRKGHRQHFTKVEIGKIK